MARLLIVSFHYYPDLCAGSFRTTSLVEALTEFDRKDLIIDIITTLPNRYATYEVSAQDLEKSGNITINRIALPSHKSGMVDQSIAFTYFSYKAHKFISGKKYDLVYATSSRLMAASLGAWLAKRSNAKLYLDIRDIFVETINDVFAKRIAKIMKINFSILEKWTFNRAHHINIVSQGFIPYFAERYPNKKLSYHTNGIDNIFLKAVPDDISRTLKNDSQKTRILYAGNIGEGQGLHNIIPQMAKKLPCYDFYVIGDGGRRKHLELAIKKYEVDNVFLHNPCTRDVLIKNYLAADILFLHLNDYRAFKRVLPSKIFEYAAIGKPILAGVSGYAAEFINSEVINAKVFPPCDVDAAMEAIQGLQIINHTRSDFVKTYHRGSIMHKLAREMLELI